MCFNFLSDEFLKCALVYLQIEKQKGFGADRHRFGIDPVVTFDPTRSFKSRYSLSQTQGRYGLRTLTNKI
jgi:hypothetical protein